MSVKIKAILFPVIGFGYIIFWEHLPRPQQSESISAASGS